MNKTMFSILIATMLTVASHRPASAQSLERCDKAMADVESMAHHIGVCSEAIQKAEAQVLAEAASPTKSKPVVTVATRAVVWVEVPAGKMPPEIYTEAKTEPVAWNSYVYFAYSAYVAGDANLCTPLREVKREADCRREVTKLAFERAWLSGPKEFGEACARFENDKGKKQFSPECCAIAEKARHTPNPCEQLAPGCIPQPGRCRDFVAAFSNDLAFCERFQPGKGFECNNAYNCEKKREECRADSAYSKAFKAKDVSLCGAERRCYVLMGAGAKVLPDMAKELQKTPAGEWFVTRGWERPGRTAIDAPLPPPGVTHQSAQAPIKIATPLAGLTCQSPLSIPSNDKLVNDTLFVARSCLKMIESLVPVTDVDAALALDAREERLIRLEHKVRLDLAKGGVAGSDPNPPAKRRN